MRSSWLRVSFAPAAPGQSQSACHAARTEAEQASRQNTGGHLACNRRKCFRNASLFGRRSRDTRAEVSASMPQYVVNEAERTSARASRRCRQAHAAQRAQETLQGCDLVLLERVADARLRMAMQGEYRCVRMHLVRVTYRCDRRAETNADRSFGRRRRRSEEGVCRRR